MRVNDLSSDELNASPLEIDTLILQKMLSQGDVEQAIGFSNDLLIRSRSDSERDQLIEARLRMDRALLGAMGDSLVGAELRWCADRLNAIEAGSALHGLALLNLANWHANKGESMMALVVHSDISKLVGHPEDIRGLSRLETGRILISMGDKDPAMRHLWTAKLCFESENMLTEKLVCSLEWLNLALDEISKDAPTMSERIIKSSPRSAGGNTWIPGNPNDVRVIIEDLLPTLMRDLSGEERNDLGLILDAGIAIGESSWGNTMNSRITEIQDLRVVEALQS